MPKSTHHCQYMNCRNWTYQLSLYEMLQINSSVVNIWNVVIKLVSCQYTNCLIELTYCRFWNCHNWTHQLSVFKLLEHLHPDVCLMRVRRDCPQKRNVNILKFKILYFLICNKNKNFINYQTRWNYILKILFNF